MGCIKMKNYTRRINLWIDEDFESNVEYLTHYLTRFKFKGNCGKISTSDVIRHAIQEYTETARSVEESLDKEN